jgi:hypothetical protein
MSPPPRSSCSPSSSPPSSPSGTGAMPPLALTGAAAAVAVPVVPPLSAACNSSTVCTTSAKLAGEHDLCQSSVLCQWSGTGGAVRSPHSRTQAPPLHRAIPAATTQSGLEAGEGRNSDYAPRPVGRLLLPALLHQLHQLRLPLLRGPELPVGALAPAHLRGRAGGAGRFCQLSEASERVLVS